MTDAEKQRQSLPASRLEIQCGGDRSRSRWLAVALVVVGIVALQTILFAPSLFGSRILAPTDLLSLPGPLGKPTGPQPTPDNLLLLDPVETFLPWLEFAAAEVRHGRVPLWNPYAYCGSPFLANNQSAVFSPFSALFYLWPSPRAFAWIQMLKALVAGLGTFGFLRSIDASRSAAVLGGLAYPLCGFLTAWSLFPLSSTAVWMPLAFWMTETVVRKPFRFGGPCLAVVIGNLLVSGHLETAATILPAIALYGIVRWLQIHRERIAYRESFGVVLAGLLAGALGLALGTIQIAPTAEYLRSSDRLQHRRSGAEIEAPTRSSAALESTRLAFPYLLGSRQAGSRDLSRLTFNEGGPNGYAGYVMLAFLAPLGLTHSRERSPKWLFLALASIWAAPLLRLPVLELWRHIPPYDLARNDRAVLVSGWAITVLGALGFDALLERRRAQGWVLAVLAPFLALTPIALLGIAALEPARLVDAVGPEYWPWFQRRFLLAGLIALVVAGCARLWWSEQRHPMLVRILIGCVVVVELLVNAWGYNPQPSETTYYPQRDFITYLRERIGTERVCGMDGYFTPNVPMMYGLRDIRGYDAVDPLPILDLVSTTRNENRSDYARTMFFSSGPAPLLDMLSVRYALIPSDTSGALETAFRASDSWRHEKDFDGLSLYRNSRAAPRVHIPRQAERVDDRERVLGLLRDPTFDPRDRVLISGPGPLPETAMSGSARIVREDPGEVVLEVEAHTDSIVVLTDAWSPGWKVSVDGSPAEALRANHALRAVAVPAGSRRIRWRYDPASYRWGRWITLAAMALVVAWFGTVLASVGRKSPVSREPMRSSDSERNSGSTPANHLE